MHALFLFVLVHALEGLQGNLGVSGFLLHLLDRLLLFFEDLTLFLDLLSQSDGFLIQSVLLSLLVDLLLTGQTDLLVQLLNSLQVILDLNLSLFASIDEVSPSLPDSLQFLILFLSLLDQFFILLVQVLQSLLFSQLNVLFSLDFQLSDVPTEHLDLLSLTLFLISLILHFLVGLRDLLAEGRYTFHFTRCHADSCTDVGGSFKNLSVKLLALLDKSELLFISGLQSVVNVLILLAELLHILIPHDLLQEQLEFTFNVLELLRLHAHGLDLLLELHLVLHRFIVNVTIIVS